MPRVHTGESSRLIFSGLIKLNTFEVSDLEERWIMVIRIKGNTNDDYVNIVFM